MYLLVTRVRMRSRLFQALLGCTTRATRPRSVQVVRVAPQPMTFVPPVACEPLSLFIHSTRVQPLVVRAAILSQARCLHLTPALCKRHRKKAKVKDDCSGHTERRRRGFNRPCPPPPKKCPPCSTKRPKKEDDCFGSKKRPHRH